MPELHPDYRAVRRPLKRVRVHRYTDRFGRHSHRLEVPMPAWAWRLVVRHGASRPPMELMVDRGIADRAASSGPTARVDYWAETEAPR